MQAIHFLLIGILVGAAFLIAIPRYHKSSRQIVTLAFLVAAFFAAVELMFNHAQPIGMHALLVPIVLGCLALSALFTPGRWAVTRVFVGLLWFGCALVITLTQKNTALFLALSTTLLVVPALTSPSRWSMVRLTTTFVFFVGVLIVARPWLPGGEHGVVSQIVIVLAIAMLLGLFPVSAWHGRLFESAPSSMLAALTLGQVTIAVNAQGLLEGVDHKGRLLLTVLALTSALAALVRQDMRRAVSGFVASQIAMVAYAHAFATNNSAGNTLLAVSLMISTTGIILALGALEARRGKLSLSRPSGNFESTPRLAIMFLVFGLMSAGFPFSLMFIAEELVFQSRFLVEPFVVTLWLLVAAVNAITVIKLYLFLFYGKREYYADIDLQPSKFVAAFSIMFALFAAVFVAPAIIH